MKLTLSILFILCGFSTFSAFAQDSKTLTLESAVQIALDKNQTVIEGKNSVEVAKSSTMSSFGTFLPDLSFSGGFTRSQNWANTIYAGNIPISTGGSFQASNRYSAGLSSSLLLFNGLANFKQYNGAKANERAATYNYSRVQQSTIYQTHQLFLSVVRAYELLKVSEDNLKRSRGQLERITESNKVGAVAIADVYRQKTLVGSDELSMIQAQTNYDNAKADVMAFLGLPIDPTYQFDFTGIPTDIDTTEFAALNAKYNNFTDLVSQAVNARPDHQANIATRDISESSVSVAKAAYFPTVNAFADYGYNNQEFSTLMDNKGLTVGLNINLPIFNGFARETNIQQKQLQQNDAEVNVKQSELKVTVDVRKALLNLEGMEKEVMITQASVQSAEMDRKIAEEKYNLGSGTILDLQVATANYTQALSNKVNAVNDFLLAKKNVEYSLGIITR